AAGRGGRLVAGNRVARDADEPAEGGRGAEAGLRKPRIAEGGRDDRVVAGPPREPDALALDPDQLALVPRRRQLAEHRGLQGRVRVRVVERLVGKDRVLAVEVADLPVAVVRAHEGEIRALVPGAVERVALLLRPV